MRRGRRGRRQAPPPTPPGMVWEVDGSELVTAEDFAKESRDEMKAFDSLPKHVQRELRASGQSALAYLKWARKQREKQILDIFLDW